LDSKPRNRPENSFIFVTARVFSGAVATVLEAGWASGVTPPPDLYSIGPAGADAALTTEATDAALITEAATVLSSEISCGLFNIELSAAASISIREIALSFPISNPFRFFATDNPATAAATPSAAIQAALLLVPILSGLVWLSPESPLLPDDLVDDVEDFELVPAELLLVLLDVDSCGGGGGGVEKGKKRRRTIVVMIVLSLPKDELAGCRCPAAISLDALLFLLMLLRNEVEPEATNAWMLKNASSTQMKRWFVII